MYEPTTLSDNEAAFAAEARRLCDTRAGAEMAAKSRTHVALETAQEHSVKVPSEADRFLNIAAAHQEVQAMGFAATERQVRRWAEERALPFFKWQRSLYIKKSVLHRAFDDMQTCATRLAKAKS